jgi:23S rRNA (adenine2503-C2)-methyltransferase
MAKKVAQYLHGLPVRINVIVCNKIDSVHFVSPEPEQVSRFCRWLVEEKLFVRRRLSQGSAIMGACGQLRSAHLAGKVSTCLK